MSNRDNRQEGGPVDIQGTESKNKGSFKDLGKGTRQNQSDQDLGNTSQQNVNDSSADKKQY